MAVLAFFPMTILDFANNAGNMLSGQGSDSTHYCFYVTVYVVWLFSIFYFVVGLMVTEGDVRPVLFL